MAGFALRVFRLKDGARHKVLMLSTWDGNGIITHFVKRRSVYCTGRDSCKDHRQAASWRGYVHALVWHPAENQWVPVAFEVTERLELEMRGVYSRGQVWEVFRPSSAKGERQAVQGRVIETRPAAELPREIDIRPVLCTLYHETEVELTIPNPLPAKIIVELETLAPPVVDGRQETAPTASEVNAVAELLRKGRHVFGLKNGR
jgi:hypothetical protein